MTTLIKADFDLANAYARGEVQGWAETINPGTVARAREMLRGTFPEFGISGQARETAGQKMFLFWPTMKHFGCTTAVPDYFPQAVGDCVSFGAKHATEITQGIQAFLRGDRLKWRPVFPSYYYGTGRIYVGHSGGDQDGSSGAWMAEAVQKYGTLFADEDGCPKYSGQVAKAFGRDSTEIDKWKPKAIAYPVKSAALISNWEDLVAAIVNGYPCTTASNVGYDMEPGPDGFHRQRGTWSHQMCFVGVDETYTEPYALILNNWGDCFSDDTEVLTKGGWKLFKDVSDEDKLATLNTDTWCLEYQKPTARQERLVDGNLIHCSGRDIDLLVTPGHRMYIAQFNSDKRDRGQWGFTRAEDLNKHFFVKKDADWEGVEYEYIPVAGECVRAEDWFEFMGYFLSEGSVTIGLRTNYSEAKANCGLKVACPTKQKVATVCIAQKGDDPIISSCLARLPFHFGPHRGHQWHCGKQALGRYLHKFGKAHEKFVPDYIKNGSRRLIRIFFDAAMRGDGSDANGRYVYYTSSRRLADDMQELALKCGYAADVNYTDRVGRDNGSGGITRHIEYRVLIKRQELMQHVKHAGLAVPYRGNVYCFTVPNGTLYVRRNGKAAWCGNCHGHLKDFQDGTALPPGILRVRKADAMKHVNAGETYAYSAFQGFPEQALDKSLFLLG